MPRAELWAAIVAARTAPDQHSLTLGVDAAYVVKGMGNPSARARLSSGKNGDLWSALWELVQRKSLQINARKVKAHGENAVLQGKMELQDYLGNLLADCGAGAAAENAVDTCVAQHISEWETRAFLIAKRLAVIEADL